MRIKSISKVSGNGIKAHDCYVGDAYVKRHHASLPDVDCDFDSTRRPEVKAYLEKRYNHNKKQRVFSAGTFTTEKIRSVIKDVCRVHKIPVGTINYITAIIDDSSTWTDLMRTAVKEKKVRDFIERYPEVFEEILPLMNQPRSAGVHASALIVVPDTIKGKDVECFDIVPIRKMDDLLVSEIDGYSLDDMGLLKNDVLAIAELSRLSEMMNICNKEYKANIDMLKIITNYLDEPAVFDVLKKGLTQGVFQMSGAGITRFIKQMKPNCIQDLIASVALFRPGTLDSGAAQMYCDVKNGLVEPEYLWGTYEILKETHGVIAYQESVSHIAQKIGGLSLSDGVKLVKALSKKKLEKAKVFKDDYFKGAEKNGCPKEVAEQIWHNVELATKYCFNKCISGKESIMRPSKCGKYTIAEMYHIMNDVKWAKQHGVMPLRSRYLRLGYGSAWSLNDNNELVKNHIKDIRYMGKRSLYRITLENGKTIDVTDNHKHPTDNGIKRTDQLVVGKDMMYCYSSPVKEDTCYRFTDKGGANNNPEYHSNDNLEHYALNVESGHMGFTKRDSKYTKLRYYQENLKKDYCEICGAKNCRLEVHHINKDHSDCGENFSNLITVCASCHKKEHYKIGRTKMGEHGIMCELSRVKSINYIGEDDVYDVEMDDPWHTFTTGNGVVTCNSHATAYGLTAYIGAWIKVHYPIAFYSVLLKWVEKDKLPILMNEMREIGNAKIVQPDINISSSDFVTDFKTNTIYWSISRIKQLGEKAVAYIVKERNLSGQFLSLEEFINRIFKYKLKQYQYWDDPDNPEEYERCPVTAMSVRHLIMAGAFDTLEGVKTNVERYGLMVRAAQLLGFEIQEKDIPADLRDKHWFWSQKQISIAGIGAIDYKRIFQSAEKDGMPKSVQYFELRRLSDELLGEQRVAICATIAEVSEKVYKDKRTGENKKYGKIVLHQNTDTASLLIWNDAWTNAKEFFIDKKGRIVIAVVNTKYSDFDEMNVLQLNKGAFVMNV